jgi:DNA (cytosine-5)-methyltransferase 1
MKQSKNQLSLVELGLAVPAGIHLRTRELKYAHDFMGAVKRFKEPNNPVGNVAELFAGVGGFRLGLSRAGWRTTYSNQWEPSTKTQHASNVYVARFGEDGHSNEDIAKVRSLPRGIDLLVGGFPCQDYSVAKTLSSAKGLEGKKGVLWWEILRLVEHSEPRFVFLENVDRLLKSPSTQRGRDFAVMLKTLGDAGYLVEWRVINAAEYGFPQRRIRVFIVATRVAKRHRISDASRIIVRSGVLARAFAVSGLKSDVLEVDLGDDVLGISNRFNRARGASPFLNSGVYLNGIAHTAKVEARVASNPKVLKDIVLPDSEVPEDFWIDDRQLREWKYLKGAKTISRVHKASGYTYNYAEGKMAFPDLLTNPSRTILTGEGGSTPSRFKHIIKTRRGYRRLTPVELERLNGFPDDWTLHDCNGNEIPDARRAFFMGNALVVGLVEKVGRVLASDFISKT